MSEEALTPTEYNALFNSICDRWNLSVEDRQKLSRSPESIDNLFSLSVLLDQVFDKPNIKEIQFPKNQAQPFFDMIVGGRIHEAIRIAETVLGGQIIPARPSAIPQEVRDRYFKVICGMLKLSDEEAAKIPRPTVEEERKLGAVAVALKTFGYEGQIKTVQIGGSEHTPFYDLVVAGKIDEVVGILSAAGHGPIYVPLSTTRDRVAKAFQGEPGGM